jgi:hypothetical protein
MNLLALRSGLALRPLSPAISFGPVLAGFTVHESRRRSSLKIELLGLIPSLRQVDWLRCFSRCRIFGRRRRAAVIIHISRRISAGILLLNVTHTAIPLIDKLLFQITQGAVVWRHRAVVWRRRVLVDWGKRGGGALLAKRKRHGDGIKQIIDKTLVFRILEDMKT